MFWLKYFKKLKNIYYGILLNLLDLEYTECIKKYIYVCFKNKFDWNMNKLYNLIMMYEIISIRVFY